MRNTKLISGRSILVALVAVAFCATSANAVVLTFLEPDFNWQSIGGGTPYHIWTTGDFWQQQFNGTGLPSANHMDLHLFIDDNVLSGGAQVNLNATLNNVVVGAFTIPQGVAGFVDFSFNFASIPGPNYFVNLVETNTVAPGLGSVSMAPDGRSTVTLTGVPEPTLAFAAPIAIASIRMRRRRSAVA